MRAPVSSRPPIFGSPIFPAPTTRTCLPLSLINIGNKLVTDTSCRLDENLRGGQISRDGGHAFSCQKLAQLGFAVPRKETAQILGWLSLSEIAAQKTLEGVGNFTGQAAISDRTRNGLMQAEGATHAEVVRVREGPIDFDFLAFDADISNPVLSATVGTSGDMQLQVLVEARQAFFHLLH